MDSREFQYSFWNPAQALEELNSICYHKNFYGFDSNLIITNVHIKYLYCTSFCHMKYRHSDTIVMVSVYLYCFVYFKFG